MAEKVSKTGVSKEKGFLYYLDKNGNVSRSRMARGASKGGNAEVVANGKITDTVAKEALGKLEVDPLGLDDLDNRILMALADKFEGNPVGLDTLAASVTEDPDTIMDVHEPYLLQLGFIKRTPRGRIATKRAFTHLGIQQNKPGDLSQLNLWTTED